MLILPIGDENPREKTPYVNYTILALNILFFVLYCFPSPTETMLIGRAMIPQQVSLVDPSTWGTMLSSMFLHADIFHLLGNMLFPPSWSLLTLRIWILMFSRKGEGKEFGERKKARGGVASFCK